MGLRSPKYNAALIFTFYGVPSDDLIPSTHHLLWFLELLRHELVPETYKLHSFIVLIQFFSELWVPSKNSHDKIWPWIMKKKIMRQLIKKGILHIRSEIQNEHETLVMKQGLELGSFQRVYISPCVVGVRVAVQLQSCPSDVTPSRGEPRYTKRVVCFEVSLHEGTQIASWEFRTTKE